MNENHANVVTGGWARIFVESTNECVAVNWNAAKNRGELRDG